MEITKKLNLIIFILLITAMFSLYLTHLLTSFVSEPKSPKTFEGINTTVFSYGNYIIPINCWIYPTPYRYGKYRKYDTSLGGITINYPIAAVGDKLMCNLDYSGVKKAEFLTIEYMEISLMTEDDLIIGNHTLNLSEENEMIEFDLKYPGNYVFRIITFSFLGSGQLSATESEVGYMDPTLFVYRSVDDYKNAIEKYNELKKESDEKRSNLKILGFLGIWASLIAIVDFFLKSCKQ